jgi:hypothetical protein
MLTSHAYRFNRPTFRLASAIGTIQELAAQRRGRARGRVTQCGSEVCIAAGRPCIRPAAEPLSHSRASHKLSIKLDKRRQQATSVMEGRRRLGDRDDLDAAGPLYRP